MPLHKLKKRPVDQDVLTLALDRLRYVYSLFDHVAVSFSGGKDSTAVLNLTARIAAELDRLPLHVVFFDEEALPDEVEDYVRRVAARPDIQLDWYCIPIKHRNACSRQHPYWYPWGPEDKDKWVRPMPSEAIQSIPGYHHEIARRSIPEISGLVFDPTQYGRVAMIMGLRARESLSRYRAVASRKEENYIVKHSSGFRKTTVMGYGNTWKVYPIYDWTTQDVWTAVAEFDWDYCSVYDLWEMEGLPHEAQRLAQPFGEEPLRSIATYKSCFPQMWDKLLYRVPGAISALLYSQTELYGFSELPERPAHLSWPEYLNHIIESHHPAIRRVIATRIKEEIKRHRNKTNDPILDIAPHPETGLSWNALLTLAIRADLKGRRRPDDRVELVGTPERARAEARYREALEKR